MKKILVLAVVAVFSVALVGCGGTNAVTSQGTKTMTVETKIK